MHIALVTDGLSPYAMGGMQRHSRMLAESLVRSGVDVTVFHTAFDAAKVPAASALEGFPPDVRDRMSHEFVPYPRVGRLPGHYLAEEWRYSTACLRRYLDRDVRADFIYAQGLTGWAFLRLRERSTDLPPIGVNTHGYEMFQRAADLRGALQYAFLRPAFRDVNIRADVVFSFSGKIRHIVERRVGVPADRIAEMPNGIEESWLVAASASCRNDVRRFIFVGRHDRRKGLPELLAAIPALPDYGWELVVVGPIPPDRQIAHPGVRFVGAVSDAFRLQALLDGADCLLCPSHAEGMPTVILEAMARGLMIVATDVGATAEIVDSSNGILLAGPEPAAIADAMRRVMSMPTAEVMQRKSCSLARVRSYGWQHVARHVINVADRAIRRVALDRRTAV
jgi:glycosyltransferase involved in cell wall biosynthesis